VRVEPLAGGCHRASFPPGKHREWAGKGVLLLSGLEEAGWGRQGGLTMARHSNVPKDQRVELVLAVLRGTENLEVLARRHQVSANTLRRWRDEFLAGGKEQLTGGGDAAQVQQENRQLKRELAEREMIIGELTVANRFLQKKVDGSLGVPGNGKS
jgi:transposase-like protein